MIEASAHQTVEAELEEAFTQASKEISRLEDFQKKIVAEIGKEKRVIEQEVINPESVKLFNENIFPKMPEAIFSGAGKAKIDELHNVWNKIVAEKYPEREDFSLEDNLFDDTENDILHDKAINENKRADGRKMNELRDLFAQAGGISIVLHGSGIFYRGGTHVLSVLTLGGPEDRHMIDGMQTKAEKRFMHHYNFPPYSAGEGGRAGFTNRREVGHGALAEKALAMVLPSVVEFPYTMRIVSESMASNGSTSQASICASTLALMDGGVPIKAPVAGVAIGLMYESGTRYKILTDIQGPEDHHGDMDFKIAGTREGVTAIQLDVKINGINDKILLETLQQGREARNQILDVMEKTISKPRPELSPFAPRILTIKINPDKIREVIGPGGKIINAIIEECGEQIDVEDTGEIYVTAEKEEAAKKAIEWIKNITHEVVVGEIFQGNVKRIMAFGAFVEILPGQEGLVHISQLANYRVNKVEDVVKIGQIIPVKVIEIDEMG